MLKPKLQNYRVCVFFTVRLKSKGYDSGTIDFDLYAEDENNAILYVMKLIDKDTIISARGKQFGFNDDYSWYDLIDYNVVRVLDVILLC